MQTWQIYCWPEGLRAPRRLGFVSPSVLARRVIVRQLLAESLLLGVVGSGLGLILAVWGIDLVMRAIPVEIPYWIRFDFDWRVFTFALALGVGSAVLFGLFPALQASRPQLVDAIKEGGRSGIGGGKGQRVRNGLVVAEVALALVLLVGAGLMLRSFLKLQATDIGVDPSHTLTFRVGLPPTAIQTGRCGPIFHRVDAADRQHSRSGIIRRRPRRFQRRETSE